MNRDKERNIISVFFKLCTYIQGMFQKKET